MVPVAQRLERRTVDAEAEGSKPFRHPKKPDRAFFDSVNMTMIKLFSQINTEWGRL